MTHATLTKLQAKRANSSNRMPNMKSISKMLKELNIAHWYFGSHLRIEEARIDIDSSDTYYSWNSQSYAGQIIDFLATKGIS